MVGGRQSLHGVHQHREKHHQNNDRRLRLPVEAEPHHHDRRHADDRQGAREVADRQQPRPQERHPVDRDPDQEGGAAADRIAGQRAGDEGLRARRPRASASLPPAAPPPRSAAAAAPATPRSRGRPVPRARSSVSPNTSGGSQRAGPVRRPVPARRSAPSRPSQTATAATSHLHPSRRHGPKAPCPRAPRPLDQGRRAPALAPAPSASTPTRPSAPARRRSAPPSSISATCRSTRSTSSSARTTTSSGRRIPGYARGDLGDALSADKSVFEYWAHALAYIPTRDYRFFMADMKRHRANPLGLVRQRHPGRPAPHRRPGPPRGCAHHPRHRRRRAGRQGPPLGQPQALEARAAARLLRRHADDQRPRRHGEDLRAGRPPLRLAAAPARRHRGARASTTCSTAPCGPRASSASIRSATWTPRARSRWPRCIEARVRRRRLVPVAIDGLKPHWATPEALAEPLPETDRVHILSPFDPLVIQRRRLADFFGYDHRFEAYVPAAKRQLGYFALPVLVGDRVAAAIDLKADRAGGKLLIQQWTWIDDARRRPAPASTRPSAASRRSSSAPDPRRRRCQTASPPPSRCSRRMPRDKVRADMAPRYGIVTEQRARRADGEDAGGRQDARPRPRARRRALGHRLLRGAHGRLHDRRPGRGHAGADGPLARRLRQLGDRRHRLLQALRPGAARLRQGRRLGDAQRRVRPPRRLRAAGLRWRCTAAATTPTSSRACR